MTKSIRAVVLVSAVGLAMALGCSRDDAREAADEAGAAAGQMATEARRTGEDMMGYADPVARCKELAAKGAWDQALEPCTAAHEAEPDDMAIEHALQQAKAAAGP